MDRNSVVPRSEGEITAADKNWFYLAREPVIVALLSALAVVFFLAVTGLSHLYHAQQQSLGNRWFTRGTAVLAKHGYEPAVADFRTALLYSRDDYAYQLSLAEALIGLKRTNEAYSYLVTLWEREPENGSVNLELARIAADKEDTEQTLRYYHNAIYATWPGDQEQKRRDARLELIQFLLGINAKAQAQAELIALAANLADDPSQQAHIGDLFLKIQDYEHALTEYRLSLRSDRNDPTVSAGAGQAAFDLGRYLLAQRYLQAAVSANPSDAQSAVRLKTTELILRMDPFQRQMSVDQRGRIAIEAFAAAGERLKSCSPAGDAKGPPAFAAPQQSLAENWAKLKTQITARLMRRNPDLVDAAMEVVFDIERQTSSTCGPPTETDTALLLLAKLHEGI